MTHEAFREMLPLYVIGSLDGDELHNFERYIAENRERCQVEIAAFQAVADQIALAPAFAQPSPAVYERIAAAIEESRRPVAAPAPAAVKPREREGLSLGGIILRVVPWAATAVLAVMLLGAYGQNREVSRQLRSMTSSYNELIGKSNQQQGNLTDLSGRLESQAKEIKGFNEKVNQLQAKNEGQGHDLDALRSANKELTDEKDRLLRAADQMREQLERQTLQTAALQKKIDEHTSSLDLVMDPATRVAPLADPKGESKAIAKVYWHSAKKMGFMVVSNLPPVRQDQGKCLELWAICGSEPPVAAGVGWTDDSGHGKLQVKLAKDVSCIDKFAVTVERTGGVPAPEGAIILIGQ